MVRVPMWSDTPLPNVAPVSLVDADPTTSWPSDEIAIDFPSLDRIVARMRDSFLGTSGDAVERLTADVTMTAEQARRGGSVPVEVPLWRVCARCAGRGEIWDEACGHCAGVGHGIAWRRLDVHVPPGVRHGMWMAFEVAGQHAPATLVHLRVAIR